MNLLLAFVIFFAHRLARDAGHRASGSRRSSRARRRRPPASQPGDAILARRRRASTSSSASGDVLDGPPGARRRDRHARPSQHADGTRRRPSRSRSGRRRERRRGRERRRDGPLGITAASRASRRASTARTSAATCRARSASASSETVRWFGLILAGLGDLVGGFVTNPTAPPPVAGPVGIATQIGDIFFGAGPDPDALRRRHPVGQPGPREQPAVPAARRRPDR